MTTLTIDDRLAERLRAAHGEAVDLNQAAAAALAESVERWERQAAARAEAQAVLNGPRRPWVEADADFRRRHNLPDYVPMSVEERADEAERIIAAMDPKARQELERDGWL